MERPNQENARAGVDESIGRLFEQALAGDPNSYRAFLLQTAEVLRSFLADIARRASAEKVEDLVQEVLLAIHEKRDLYRPGMPVMPWVRAIAKHRLIDSIRADSRRPELIELSDEIERALMTGHDDGQRGIRQMEAFYDLDALLVCLDERQKRILKLAKLEQLSLEEIANRLGISHALVKVTVHRSLQKVRDSING